MALPKKMRLTVAAFIASVTLGVHVPAQAQFALEPNDLRGDLHGADANASIVVNMRAQAVPSGAAGTPGLDASSQSQPSGPGANFQPLSGQAVVQPAPGVIGQGDGGRLAPIAMESVRAPISAANISVEEIGTKVLPLDQAAEQVAAIMPLPNGEDRALSYLTYQWQSANICHFPLYFEEPMLERHGQQICPTYLQPAVSGTKFLSNLLLYPYKATLQPALESRYTLGHFRPGSPAPLLKDTLPWSPRAAAVQGVATAGVFVGLPW